MAVKTPHRLTAARARRFRAALPAEEEGRASAPWWSSIQVVPRRLGIPYAEAVAMAEECAKARLVTHDQSHQRRRSAEAPHR